MNTIEISVEQLHDVIRISFNDLAVRNEIPLFLSQDADVQRKLVEDVCLGAEDFFEATFPKRNPTTPEPHYPEKRIHGSYSVRLSSSYHFVLSNSAWELFKESVALIVAISSMTTGDIATGGLGLTVAAREFVKTLLSNFHKLSPDESKVIAHLLKLSVECSSCPTKNLLLDSLASSGDFPSREHIVTVTQDLLEKGVLEIKNKDEGTVGIAI